MQKAFSLLALTLFMSACASVSPANVIVSMTHGLVHNVGDSVRVQAELVKKDTVVGSTKQTIGGAFIWTSSDYSIASVGFYGDVVEFKKPGVAKLCAQTHYTYIPKEDWLRSVISFAPFKDTCLSVVSKAK